MYQIGRPSTTLSGLASLDLMFGLFLLLSCTVNATVVCEECRSLDLQEGPGVGMSLAPGYGAISVKFANGTIAYVAWMQGEAEYVQAMKHWQEIAQARTIVGFVNCAERFDSAVSSRSKHSLRGWLLDRLHSIFSIEKPIAWCDPPLDEKLQPISDMMEMLFRKGNETGSLKYSKVYLAIPDTVHDRTRDSPGFLRALLQVAGLEGFSTGGVSCQPQSKVALRTLYGLSDCFGIPRYQPPDYVGVDRDSHEGRMIVNGVADGPLDPDTECESYHGRRVQNVLSIHIDSQSLSFRSMIRDDGWLMLDLGIGKLLWTPSGGELTGSKRHWRWMRDELRTFVETASLDFDALVLSGPEATDTSFQSVIRDVFGGNEKIVQAEYARDHQDHIFAAARGASELARDGMCTEFTCCIPNKWCPQSEYCKEFQCFWWDDDKGKDEL